MNSDKERERESSSLCTNAHSRIHGFMNYELKLKSDKGNGFFDQEISYS